VLILCLVCHILCSCCDSSNIRSSTEGIWAVHECTLPGVDDVITSFEERRQWSRIASALSLRSQLDPSFTPNSSTSDFFSAIGGFYWIFSSWPTRKRIIIFYSAFAYVKERCLDQVWPTRASQLLCCQASILSILHSACALHWQLASHKELFKCPANRAQYWHSCTGMRRLSSMGWSHTVYDTHQDTYHPLNLASYFTITYNQATSMFWSR